MTIHEHQRYSLHQALENSLGPDAAATLMTLLPPVGWADVATKHDLTALGNELRAELHTGLAHVRTEIADVRTEIHKSVRTMTLTFVGATAAIVSAIAALTNLFG